MFFVPLCRGCCTPAVALGEAGASRHPPSSLDYSGTCGEPEGDLFDWPIDKLEGEHMRIVVTGGSGKIRRAAVSALRAAGHRTVNFDIRASPDGGRQTLLDCADFGQLMGGLSGVDTLGGVPDAVVH